jgi:chromosomal replication initiation ATPase DnaA
MDKVRDQPKEKMFKNSNSDKYVMDRFNREFRSVEIELIEDIKQNKRKEKEKKALVK